MGQAGGVLRRQASLQHHRQGGTMRLLVCHFAGLLPRERSLVASFACLNLLPLLQVDDPRWLAVEVLKEREYGVKADIYALGMVLWELVALEVPQLVLSLCLCCRFCASLGLTYLL